MTPWKQLLGNAETETDPSTFPGLLETVLRLVPGGHTPIFGLEGTGERGRSLAAVLIGAGYLVKDVNQTSGCTAILRAQDSRRQYQETCAHMLVQATMR